MSNWFLYSAKQRHLSLSDAEDGVHEIKRINTCTKIKEIEVYDKGIFKTYLYLRN